MNDIEYKFIGWCKEKDHDKVWSSFKINDHWYCAWGRRGKKLQFKDHGRVSSYSPNYHAALEKVEATKRRGKSDGSSKYKEVDAFMLFTVFPDFSDQLEKELSFAMLAGTIK